MKIRILFAICLFFNLFSCKTEVKEIKTIDVDVENPIAFLNLSDYFQSEIVKLEKNEKCLIGSIDKIIVYKDYVFVLDKTKSESLFMFSRTGKYIRKIGNRGKGFGEYLYLESFDIVNDKIYLLTGLYQRLFVYDLEGQLIEVKKLSDHGGCSLNMFPDETFLTLRANSLLSVIFWGEDGRIKKTIKNDEYSFVNWGTSKGISRHGNKLFICPIFNDVIYEVEHNKIKPIFSLNYGSKNYRMDDIHSKQELQDWYNSRLYTTLSSFSISKDFICATFNSTPILYGLYFIKKDSMILARNLFYNNLPLLSPVGDVEDGVIYSIDAMMMNRFMEINQGSVFPLKVQGIKPDDNPVVVILKQKESAFN